MEITPTNAGAPMAAVQKTAAADAAAPTSDFQTFLTLLTTQMRNQDPLKPMESTEFVAQLASFSAVEQQVRSNDRLDAILAALNGGTAGGLAAWVGREVRAPTAARFDGVPVEVEVTPNPEADAAVLVVRNAFDQVVSRQPVPTDARLVTWTGENDVGQVQPHGDYTFAIESRAGDAVTDSQPGRVFGEVVEVRIEDGAAQLVLGDGTTVGLDAVTAVR